MIKNRKFLKFLLSIFLPVVVFLSLGFFSFGAISTALAIPEPEVPDAAGGGAFYIGRNSTFTMTTGTISGFSTNTFGGGVYVADGGTFNMSGGSIYGNTAAKDGSQICNYGTFTMTGGTIGKNGTTASESGICNHGKMNLYGGTIYEGILSEYAIMSTKMACNIQGTITLPNNESMTVEDYAGTTPSYTIVIDSTRTPSTIVTFKGSSTEPDVSKLNISGYNTSKYAVKTVKDSSGNWTVALANNSFEFPSDWKTQVASATYMTTTITPANLTGIQFVKNVPTGFTKIGTLSTGLPVYQGTTATKIAFVAEKIYAPENSSNLFSSLSKLPTIDTTVFDTSKVADMSCMFYDCSGLASLNVSNFDTTNVTYMGDMFTGCSRLTSLDLSNFNTTKVTDMSNMFSGCSGLTSLNLSSFDMTNVGTYDNMLNFGSTGRLKELKTPYNNTSALSITTGSTLYNVETGAAVTSVPANTTASKTYATQLTLTFDANGGTCNTTSATAYYNVSLHDSGFVFPYPTKSGYMFSGWYQTNLLLEQNSHLIRFSQQIANSMQSGKSKISQVVGDQVTAHVI